MQKPLTIAVVGKGSSESSWNTSQPSLTNAIASCGDLKRVNSSTSAPAMKPSFAERMIKPFGFSAPIARSAPRSSSSAWREKVLADSPCLSKVSHTSPSRSFSQRQCFARTCGSMRSIASPLDCFDEHRAAKAAADADARHAALLSRAFQGFQKVKHDARSRCAHRMAERNGAAVHVQLALVQRTHRAIEAQLFAAVLLVLPRREAAEHLRGERLVDLPVIEIVEAEAVALEDRRRRMHRTEAHLCRIEPGPFGVDDAADRLQPMLTQCFFGREDQPGGAVGDLRAVAGGDGAVLSVAERAQPAPRFGRSIASHAVVERIRLAVRVVERFNFATARS